MNVYAANVEETSHSMTFIKMDKTKHAVYAPSCNKNIKQFGPADIYVLAIDALSCARCRTMAKKLAASR